jgi:hypothetical protein
MPRAKNNPKPKSTARELIEQRLQLSLIYLLDGALQTCAKLAEEAAALARNEALRRAALIEKMVRDSAPGTVKGITRK